MKQLTYKPLEGRTYSLTGEKGDPSSYYVLVGHCIDLCESVQPDRTLLLNLLRNLDNHKVLRYKKSPVQLKLEQLIKENIFPKLEIYTQNVEKHLSELPFYRVWDRRLRLKRVEYHLIMLQVELINRMNRNRFISAEVKVALLPYCLRDLSKSCKAVKGDLDYICQACSADCFVNHSFRILRKYKVEPYLWMNRSLKGMLRKLKHQYKSIGVFGIACIPELFAGMNNCLKYGIPVLGVPLNANRCIRWMGDFYENSVYLQQIEHLLSEQSQFI